MSPRTWLIVAVTSLWLGGTSLAAESVTTGDASAGGLDDVVVTARRVEEPARRVPVSVTAVSAERLDALSINTPLDLNKIAGLGGAPIGGLANVNFSIRGQGTAYGGQPGVISYFGEVPGFPLTYFDLKNVQVIKGPQGTLFGQTSIGGVVLFEPQRPTFSSEGYLDLQGGGHDFAQFEGAVNLPLIADRLAVRVAGQLRDRRGWSTGVYSDGRAPRDLNDVDTASVRVGVRWQVSAAIDSYTLYAQDRLRGHGTSALPYYVDIRFMNPAVRNLQPAAVPALAAAWQFWTGQAPPAGRSFAELLLDAQARQLAAGSRRTFTNYSQRTTTMNRGVINQTDVQIAPALRLRNIAAVRWQTQQGAVWDIDGTDLPLDDVQCRFVPGTTSAQGQCARTGGWPARTVTEELQLQGRAFTDRLRWQLGAFYLQSGLREFREVTGPFIVFARLNADPASAAFCSSLGVVGPCAALSKTTTHSRAVFGEASWPLTERLHLTAGWRDTWDYTRTDTTAKRSYSVSFQGQAVTVPVYGEAPAAGAGVASTVVDLPANSSYTLSLDWQVNDATLVYLAHRKGYKAGGINAVAAPGTPQREYGPEVARDLEAGAKFDGEVGGLRTAFNIAAYRTWHRDIQGGQIIPGIASTVTTNLASATIDGVELEGTLQAAPWLRISANVALTDANYTRWRETSVCSAQYWRPQCAGRAASTPIAIDHAAGLLTIDDQVVGFTPDRFANTSRWQWAVQPTLSLQPWLDADVSLGANVYHRGPYVDSTAVANTSKIAGVPLTSQPTAYGGTTANPYDAPGYTLVDARVDWRNIRGTRLSLSAVATNVANRVYRVSASSAFEIIGDVYTVTGEPRMWFVQAVYRY